MTRVIIAFPKTENGKKIQNILAGSGISVAAVCVSGAQAIQEAERLEEGIVLCAHRLPDMVCDELREYIPPGFGMIVISGSAQWEEDGGEGIVRLSMPIKVHELISTVQMVEATLFCGRKRKAQKPGTRSFIDEETIRRAKDVLMERNKMSEPEAHRYLQKTSMDNSVSLTETAQMILSMMDGG